MKYIKPHVLLSAVNWSTFQKFSFGRLLARLKNEKRKNRMNNGSLDWRETSEAVHVTNAIKALSMENSGLKSKEEENVWKP